LDNTALYFQSRINKKCTPSGRFFGDFAHWDVVLIGVRDSVM